jgi:hypothetical protein
MSQSDSKSAHAPRLARVAAGSALLLLAACSGRTGNEASAGGNSQATGGDNVAAETRSAVDRAAGTAKAAAREAAEKAKPALDKAGAVTRNAVETAHEKSGPALDKASQEAKRGLGKLSHATGQALVKAGHGLESAGANAARDADREGATTNRAAD